MLMSFTGISQDIETPLKIDSIIVIPINVVQYMNSRVKKSYMLEELVLNQDSVINELQNQLALKNTIIKNNTLLNAELESSILALSISQLNNESFKLNLIDLKLEKNRFRKQRNRSRLINAIILTGGTLWLSLK